VARVLHARPGGARVVPAELLDATERARRIVADARTEADRLRAHAREHGFEAGRLEALAGQLTAGQARDRALLEAEGLVVELALAAARTLVQSALELEPERVLDVVRPLLEQVRRAHRIELHVHPDDAPVLRRWLAQALGGDEAEGLRLHEDAELSRGGCLVVTDRGTLDARVEVQLSALQRALSPQP
jgi:flagellar biosynthesis/type III secretory pathway protein FliH